MAINDWYRAEMRSQFLGQQLLNVFHYQHTQATTGDALLLAGRVANQILPALRAVCSTSWSMVSIDVYNLDNPLDFAIYPITQAGLRAGDEASQFTTWSFTYLRGRSDMKSGGKRFGGLSESDFSGGLPSGGILSALTTLAVALESNLAALGTEVWRPRILGKRVGSLGQFMNPISGVNLLGTYTMNTRKNYTAPGF